MFLYGVVNLLIMLKINTYETTILTRTKTNKYLKEKQYEDKKAMVTEVRLLGLLIYKSLKQI